MELLNSKVNHKDYMCDHTAWGVELCKRVGSANFKLLYDIYHMQIMEGDVIRTIRESAPYIAHYHTAGNPGRNEFEPQDEQELTYRFPRIRRAGVPAEARSAHLPARRGEALQRLSFQPATAASARCTPRSSARPRIRPING